MVRKFLPVLILAFLFSSCISVEVEATKEPTPANFVTATLAPTKPVYVPPTLTSTPEFVPTATFAVTLDPNCTDSAVLVRDVTIPDGTQMKPGEKFTKTWEFLNNGKCPWHGYLLKFAAGDQMNAPLSAPIPETPLHESVLVSVDLTAPAADGSYTGYFTLNNPNGKDVPIGTEKTFWVKIRVGNASVTPQSTTSGSGSSGSTSGVGNCNYSQNAGYVNQIVALINGERANAGLAELTVNPQLEAAAQGHSTDMACNNFLGHTGSDGSYINDRLARAGYPLGNGFSEVIAIGTPQDAINQWKSDQPHWDVILNAGSTAIGVGYAYSANSDYGGYITVDFGTP
ncbi:MAG TPA: NBR1-Ig-like domain-containing protein [Anaerolineales bacterium]|nr:NBR1-Ig-like domain-containing protein [Anaerolineales bacterium]